MSVNYQTWTSEKLKRLMQQSEMETRKEIAESAKLEKSMALCMDIMKTQFILYGDDFENDCMLPASAIGEHIDDMQTVIRATWETLELKEQAKQAQAVMDAGHQFESIRFGDAVFNRKDGAIILSGCCNNYRHQNNEDLPF